MSIRIITLNRMKESNMLKLLDCFCGMGGVSDGFAMEGFDVTGIDIVDAPKMLGYKHKFIQADMLTLKGEDFRGYDVVWASPPCECFSVASISTHWTGGDCAYIPKTEKAESALNLVCHTLRFIDAVQPKLWIMENPHGVLRKVINIPLVGTLTYCQYGDNRMKPTDFWGKIPESFIFKRCQNSDPCHQRAPRGAKTGTQGLKNKCLRAKVPLACSRAFAKACRETLEEQVSIRAVNLL